MNGHVTSTVSSYTLKMALYPGFGFFTSFKCNIAFTNSHLQNVYQEHHANCCARYLTNLRCRTSTDVRADVLRTSAQMCGSYLL